MVIRPDDRLSDVIDRDPRVVDALLEASPELRGLGNPTTRRVMGRLATMRQIATMAGLEPEIFVRRLNRRLGGSASAREAVESAGAARQQTTTRKESSMDTNAAPAGLARIPEELVHELDVREDLRQGREPFSRIMAARQQVPTGGALRLRATFEPVPLYAVMAKQGFDHWTETLAADDWIVWFYPAGAEAGGARGEGDGVAAETTQGSGQTAATGGSAGARGDEAMVILDVRGMEPPEPMVHTLAALETLPPGATLLQINERVPQFLLPKLEELGFGHDIRIQEEGVVRVFIHRTADR